LCDSVNFLKTIFTALRALVFFHPIHLTSSHNNFNKSFGLPDADI
jgi:hypothetical protein